MARTSIVLGLLLAACGGDDTPLQDAGLIADSGVTTDAGVEGDGGADAATVDAGSDAGVSEGLILEFVDAPRTDEGGASVRVRVSLAAEPSGLVDVVLSTTNENLLVPDRRQLRFTRTNWAEPVEVTLTPLDDPYAQGEQLVALWLTQQSADARYQSDEYSDFVRIRDDEVALSADSVTLGPASACVLRDGRVLCWGTGEGGRLGTGSDADVRYPTDIGLSDITAVALGARHGLALTSAREVYAWGSGPGAASDTPEHLPRRIADLSEVAEIVAANGHSCARLTSGEVRCWGENGSGQLGDGTMASRTSPVVVSTDGGPLTSVMALAAGGASTCALRTDGTVVCWGGNSQGELGLGGGTRTRPGEAVLGLGDAAEVVGGDAHYCVRLDTGRVTCWGAEAALPASPTAGAPLVALPDVANATALAAGARHTCVADDALGFLCWGESDGAIFGADQWGLKHEGVRDPDPQTFDLRFRSFSAGGALLCGMDMEGTLRCLGNPGSAVMRADGWDPAADATRSPALRVPAGNRTTLGAVRRGSTADEHFLDSGTDHTCIQNEVERMLCWGGDPAAYTGWVATDHIVPMSVASYHVVYDARNTGRTPRAGPQQSVVVGPDDSCFVERINEFYCAGTGAGVDPSYNMDQNYPFMDGVYFADVGHDHFCGIHSSEVVLCHGGNARGQRGYPMAGSGTEIDPYVVPGVANAVTVALGYEHSCVLTRDGSVVCWGANDRGQTGHTGPDRSAPEGVAVDDVVSLYAGGDATCVIQGADGAGTLSCWGAHGAEAGSTSPVANSALGDTVDSVDLAPNRPASPADAVGCARTGGDAAGTLACWGIFGGTWDAPVEVVAWESAEHRVTEYSVGAAHVCWMGLGHIRCRGDSAFGRLGDYDLYGPRVIRAE